MPGSVFLAQTPYIARSFKQSLFDITQYLGLPAVEGSMRRISAGDGTLGSRLVLDIVGYVDRWPVQQLRKGGGHLIGADNMTIKRPCLLQ